MGLNWKFLYQSVWGAEVWLRDSNNMPNLLHNCTEKSYSELFFFFFPSSDIYSWHCYFIHLSPGLPPSHGRSEDLQGNTEILI